MDLDKKLIEFISKQGQTPSETIGIIKDYQSERLLQNYIKELIPDDFAPIEQINYNQRDANTIYINEIKLLSREFDEKKLKVVHLKGISLLNDIYSLEDYKKRKINDIDILIKYDNMDESLDLLGDLGYIVESTNTRVSRDLINLYLTDVETRGIHFPEFIKIVRNNEGQFKIKMDCHISIMHFLENKDLRMSEIIDRSEQHNLDGTSIRVLEIHDRLLHLILHFTKEIFRCDTRWYLTGERRHSRDYRIRLPLLHEIALLVEKYNKTINWNVIIKRAESLHCHDELRLVLQMVNEIYGNLVKLEVIEAIKIDDEEPYLKEKYLGMFYALMLKDEDIVFLLNSKLSEKSEAIINKCYAGDKLELNTAYYIDPILENTFVDGHNIVKNRTNNSIGEISFKSSEEYFEIHINSVNILLTCKGLFFTIGSNKRSNILNSYINKFYIDLNIDNYSSLECFVLNGYTEIKFKYQVKVDLNKNKIVVILPWCLIDQTKEIKNILFDIGIPELSTRNSMLPIQKYKLNDISKKGLGNVFHCSPVLLSTIKIK